MILIVASAVDGPPASSAYTGTPSRPQIPPNLPRADIREFSARLVPEINGCVRVTLLATFDAGLRYAPHRLIQTYACKMAAMG
eukprot:2847951-Rhodomonas_salina.1